MSRRLAIALVGALLLVACPTTIAPVSPAVTDPDGGDYPGPDGLIVAEVDGSEAAAASPCGRACANLARIACREGSPSKQGVSCYRGCLSQASHQRLPTSCWARAQTPTEARTCGALRCLTL